METSYREGVAEFSIIEYLAGPRDNTSGTVGLEVGCRKYENARHTVNPSRIRLVARRVVLKNLLAMGRDAAAV